MQLALQIIYTDVVVITVAVWVLAKLKYTVVLRTTSLDANISTACPHLPSYFFVRPKRFPWKCIKIKSFKNNLKIDWFSRGIFIPPVWCIGAINQTSWFVALRRRESHLILHLQQAILSTHKKRKYNNPLTKNVLDVKHEESHCKRIVLTCTQCH